MPEKEMEKGMPLEELLEGHDIEEEIYLTEMSLKELLEGKIICEDHRIVIHPPKTNELGIMRI